MCSPSIRSILTLLCAITTFTLTTPAHAITDDEIPTQLRNEPEDGDLNGPCSLCRVDSIKAAEEVAGSNATLRIYFDDEAGRLSGSLVLTVLLYDDQYHTVTLTGVTLALQQETIIELIPVPGWDWSLDVRHLWVEFVPDPNP